MARQRVTTTSDVVEAAAHVFARKGYRSSTIDDICLEAGVSRPTIYKYVESKPWLLDQMVVLVTGELSERIGAILATADPPRDKIRQLVSMHVDLTTRMRGHYATVYSEQTELSAATSAGFRTWSHAITQQFAALIDDYARSERLALAADSTVLANLTLTMLTGLYRWHDPSGPTSPDDLADQVLAMLSGPLPGLDRREG